MNKNDYKILYDLLDEGCISSFQSILASALCEVTSFKGTKVRASLNELVKLGYVEEGIKKNNGRTFYITKNGAIHLLDTMPKEWFDGEKIKASLKSIGL